MTDCPKRTKFRSFLIILITILAIGLKTPLAFATKAGKIIGWGDNGLGQCNIPSPNTGFTAVAGGGWHSLGLKQDDSIVAWGYNDYGQCNVPVPNMGFTAVVGGGWHSLGLKEDGSIVAWGDNGNGQCNVPSPNTGFTAVAVGYGHSLGLKEDGSIVAWGGNSNGQCNIPSPNTGFVAVAAGWLHSLGLKQDGSIVVWGANFFGQCNVPVPNTGFTAAAGGRWHSLGLKQDGSIVAWGDNWYGQCNVPSPNTGFTAVAAGGEHSLGLKQDGSIVAWGNNWYGQCNIPSPNSGFITIAAGCLHSLALLNTAPVADAGDDQIVYAWIDGNADVKLDGSDSNDPDGDELTYHWSWTIDGNIYDANGVTPTIELPALNQSGSGPVGEYIIELIVNDGIEDSNSDEVVITVVPAIQAVLKVTPQTLNLDSHGNWVKAHFVMPEDFSAGQIDANTPAVFEPAGIESDYINVFVNEEGLVEVETAFDRSAFCAAPMDYGSIEVSVAGSLISGQYFYGTDTISIMTHDIRCLTSLASHWLEADCGRPDWCGAFDRNHDSKVDFADYSIFADYWLGTD